MVTVHLSLEVNHPTVPPATKLAAILTAGRFATQLLAFDHVECVADIASYWRRATPLTLGAARRLFVSALDTSAVP